MELSTRYLVWLAFICVHYTNYGLVKGNEDAQNFMISQFLKTGEAETFAKSFMHYVDEADKFSEQEKENLRELVDNLLQVLRKSNSGLDVSAMLSDFPSFVAEMLGLEGNEEDEETTEKNEKKLTALTEAFMKAVGDNAEIFRKENGGSITEMLEHLTDGPVVKTDEQKLLVSTIKEYFAGSTDRISETENKGPEAKKRLRSFPTERDVAAFLSFVRNLSRGLNFELSPEKINFYAKILANWLDQSEFIPPNSSLRKNILEALTNSLAFGGIVGRSLTFASSLANKLGMQMYETLYNDMPKEEDLIKGLASKMTSVVLSALKSVAYEETVIGGAKEKSSTSHHHSSFLAVTMCNVFIIFFSRMWRMQF